MDTLDVEGQKLVQRYLPLAKNMARKFFRARLIPDGVDFHDVRAEAFLALCQAAVRFDETRGIDFSVFARPRIRGAMIDYINLHTRAKRGKIRFHDIPDPNSDLERVDYIDSIDILFKILPIHLKLVAKLRIVEGRSQAECAEVLDVSRGHMSRLWLQIDNRIRIFAA